MNKVILIGRLTKDPELRKTPTDVSVCQFTIAVNRAFQQSNGERQADFINCIAWRNQAENLAKYIKKGGQIAVDGSIQTRSYDLGSLEHCVCGGRKTPMDRKLSFNSGTDGNLQRALKPTGAWCGVGLQPIHLLHGTGLLF